MEFDELKPGQIIRAKESGGHRFMRRHILSIEHDRVTSLILECPWSPRWSGVTETLDDGIGWEEWKLSESSIVSEILKSYEEA